MVGEHSFFRTQEQIRLPIPLQQNSSGCDYQESFQNTQIGCQSPLRSEFLLLFKKTNKDIIIVTLAYADKKRKAHN